jgi:hypothetical protein
VLVTMVMRVIVRVLSGFYGRRGFLRFGRGQFAVPSRGNVWLGRR